MSFYINIGQIRIKNSDGLTKIKNHPYHKALVKNDPKIFMKEINSSWIQRFKKSGNWEGFLELKKIIEKKGVEKTFSDPIFIKPIEGKKDKYYCHHGRHRLCILRFLYGDNLQIKVKDDHMIKAKIKK